MDDDVLYFSRGEDGIDQPVVADSEVDIDRVLSECVAIGLCDDRAVSVMKQNIASGRFTVAHYLSMWSKRLEERKGVHGGPAEGSAMERARPPQSAAQLESTEELDRIVAECVAIGLCDDKAVNMMEQNIASG
eukprot:6954971-Prymnesium_polylepis.1